VTAPIENTPVTEIAGTAPIGSFRRAIVPLANYYDPVRLGELLHGVVVTEDESTGGVEGLDAEILPLLQGITPRVEPDIPVSRSGREVVTGSRILTAMVIENEVLIRLVNELNGPPLVRREYARGDTNRSREGYGAP